MKDPLVLRKELVKGGEGGTVLRDRPLGAAALGVRGKKVLDLSGCTWEMVLYFIDQGSPVLAQIQDQVILITGYDQFANILVLYQGAAETVYWGSDDSDVTFPLSGNLFMTYLND